MQEGAGQKLLVFMRNFFILLFLSMSTYYFDLKENIFPLTGNIYVKYLTYEKSSINVSSPFLPF